MTELSDCLVCHTVAETAINAKARHYNPHQTKADPNEQFMDNKYKHLRIPNQKDWNEMDRHDLDAQHAYRQFFGKSFSEARQLFERNALFHQEDLQSMPAIPFNYYAPALADYITSADAIEDSDGASGFLGMLIWMLSEYPDIVNPDIQILLVTAADKVANNQSFYDADVEIYGLFSEKAGEIQVCANLTTSSHSFDPV